MARERKRKMKVYLLENNRKIKRLKNALEKTLAVEGKENTNFRMTKNDIVIVSDEEVFPQGIEKLKNIIFITKQKEYHYIWKLAMQYQTIDIIDSQLEETAMIQRIMKRIGKEK